jgi:hypothetical protein
VTPKRLTGGLRQEEAANQHIRLIGGVGSSSRQAVVLGGVQVTRPKVRL